MRGGRGGHDELLSVGCDLVGVAYARKAGQGDCHIRIGHGEGQHLEQVAHLVRGY